MTHGDGNSKIAHDFSFGSINFEIYVRNLSGDVLKAAAYMHLNLGTDVIRLKRLIKEQIAEYNRGKHPCLRGWSAEDRIIPT